MSARGGGGGLLSLADKVVNAGGKVCVCVCVCVSFFPMLCLLCLFASCKHVRVSLFLCVRFVSFLLIFAFCPFVLFMLLLLLG